MSGFAAIILAGGRSARMGQDKATLLWDGETAVVRLTRLATALGAGAVRVAGGQFGSPDPVPFGGPVGGLLAAAAALKPASRLLVLAVDAPTLTPGDLRPLLNVSPPGAAYAGLPLPLVVSSAALPWALAVDAPLRRLVAEAGLAQIVAPDSAWLRLRGANTPQELDHLRDASSLQAAR